MNLCSEPGCGKESVGFIGETRLGKAPTKGQRETIRARREEGHVFRPGGEICLDHLMAWFPGGDREWMLAWLKRQNEEAARSQAAAKATAEERVRLMVDKRAKPMRSVFTR